MMVSFPKKWPRCGQKRGGDGFRNTSSDAGAAQPLWQGVRRERIFARLRGGWAYDEIAREERVTPRRVRQIVSEALQRRQVDDGSDHAMLQLARLDKALRLAAEAVAEGAIGAIAPYLKVLAQFDRYQGAASAKPAYDEKARERLFAKINRVAARLDRRQAATPAAATPSPDAAEAPEPERIEELNQDSPVSH
jgi:hypothetical protein